MSGLHIKADMQGLLIYLSMAGYAACFLLTALAARSGRSQTPAGRRLIATVFIAASMLSIVSVLYRWQQVRHLPMQNMFEVFLFLGACIGPIHWFSGKILDRFHPVFSGIDSVIALVVLFPAGFKFSNEAQMLPPALQSWLFGPHVAAYMLAYIFMAKAAIFAAASLTNSPVRLRAIPMLSDYTYRLTAAGFVLLTCGLFLGSVWGKLAWGDWWGWDPKELWSLASWLIYGIYLHVRLLWPTRLRLHNSLVLLGMAAIIMTLLWVNLSNLFQSLHNYA
ncbi:MAG: cytochrome c biogenesis protein CcsA [Planctomycetaceae bacterium]|nr:cytochrome c biogenesis protein CcsA [Planctomycetaceae bacterium]